MVLFSACNSIKLVAAGILSDYMFCNLLWSLFLLDKKCKPLFFFFLFAFLSLKFEVIFIFMSGIDFRLL